MMKRVRVWDVSLDDDGSLDTVLVAVLRIAPHKRFEFRYGDTSEYRDKSGCLTELGFAELAADAADSADEILCDIRAWKGH